MIQNPLPHSLTASLFMHIEQAENGRVQAVSDDVCVLCERVEKYSFRPASIKAISVVRLRRWFDK